MENQCCWKLQHTLLLLTPFCPGAFCFHPITTPEREGGGRRCEHRLRRGGMIKITNNLFVQKTNRSKQSSKCRKSHFMHSKWVTAGGKITGGGGGRRGRRGGSQFSQLRRRDGWGCAYGAGDAGCVSRVSDRYEGRGVSETGLITLLVDCRALEDRMGLKLHSWSD